MECKICSGDRIEIAYSGPIFLGMKAGSSQQTVNVYRCRDCGVFWHNYTARREHLQIIRSISALLESSHDTLLQISPALSIYFAQRALRRRRISQVG